jgi:hypothetical protein
MTSIDTLRIKDNLFVHESGHAIIGMLKDDLRVEGIAYCTKDQKYITVVNGPGSDNLSKNFYLFLAGGMAAELLIYNDYNRDTAKKDLEFFENPSAPPLQQTIDEAKSVLADYTQQIRYFKTVL